MKLYCFNSTLRMLLAAGLLCLARHCSSAGAWTVGTPIVTYWAGPPMTDAAAEQMADGGFNLVWCAEKELAVAQRHGLRALLQDGLLTPASLENPAQREKLDALVDRVRTDPALYAYFITDEPNAASFPALGKLVAYLRQRDSAHLAYINLFPTYASNEQLGNTGNVQTAYSAHLCQYLDQVRPGLISYDHYQFTTKGDSPEYFLNLALIRRAALDAGLPFLNIVQACTWTPSMRVPVPDEMRYLVYTSLAYGAQGISYYVYCHPGHTGGIANADGTPTPLYAPLANLNRQFVAIARQLQPLHSLGVYHAGMLPPGAELLPTPASFWLDPPLPTMDYKAPAPVKGALLGFFGSERDGKKGARVTCALVVNLDYQAAHTLLLHGPSRLRMFDADTGQWRLAKGRAVELRLPPGGGKLVSAGH